MALQQANNNLSATAEARRRHIEKLNFDLSRAAEECKQLETEMKEGKGKMAALEDDLRQSLQARTAQLLAALGAVEQMHTVVCQPQVSRCSSRAFDGDVIVHTHVTCTRCLADANVAIREYVFLV